MKTLELTKKETELLEVIRKYNLTPEDINSLKILKGDKAIKTVKF